jgi:hypothetical protein
MPKIVTWTIFPHLRGSNADKSLSKGRNSLKRNLLACCHYQHVSAQAQQTMNTLTSCQGISDVFGQRGSSSTEDQHTHALSRDQRRVRSARLELNRRPNHSRPVKESTTRSVSVARDPQRIITLTNCQGISDAFDQRGSSSTEDQYTHILTRNPRRVRSA